MGTNISQPGAVVEDPPTQFSWGAGPVVTVRSPRQGAACEAAGKAKGRSGMR